MRTLPKLAVLALLGGCGAIRQDILYYNLNTDLFAFEADALEYGWTVTVPAGFHLAKGACGGYWACCTNGQLWAEPVAENLTPATLAALVYNTAGSCILRLPPSTDPTAIMYPILTQDDSIWLARWPAAVAQELGHPYRPQP
jgi:uncharacterized lipoprotein YmbA